MRWNKSSLDSVQPLTTNNPFLILLSVRRVSSLWALVTSSGAHRCFFHHAVKGLSLTLHAPSSPPSLLSPSPSIFTERERERESERECCFRWGGCAICKAGGFVTKFDKKKKKSCTAAIQFWIRSQRTLLFADTSLLKHLSTLLPVRNPRDMTRGGGVSSSTRSLPNLGPR